MIGLFVTRFDAARDKLREQFRATRPDDYDALVKAVIVAIGDGEERYREPDPERITRIDHGDYQGTLLFVIGAGGYQPDTYWATKVGYGSCSGCDTLQAIHEDGVYGEPSTDEQVRQYMELALHIVQGLKEIA